MIQRFFCRSVIHNLVVTESKPYCEGSIEIDEAIMEKAQIGDGERVMVTNVRKGGRAETYSVKAPRGSGKVESSGPMSHLAKVGDEVCVIAFGIVQSPDEIKRIDIDLKGKRNKF
jgi:aspartate 1-decarboxylase